MKRFFPKGLSCLLVLSMLVCGLVSCKSTAQKINELEEWDRFVELMTRTEEADKKIDSYTVEGEMRFHGLVSGVGTDMTATMAMTISGLLEGDYAEVKTQETVVEIPGADFEQTVTYTEGYLDGKAFRIYDADGKGQRIWSELSSADYRAYSLGRQADEALDVSLLTKETATLSYEYEKGEGWTITVSEIDDDVMDVYVTFFGVDEFVDYQTPETMTLTFGIDDDFQKKSLKIEAVYEKEGFQDATTVTLENFYKDYNTTEVKSVDLEDCTEISDLRLIYQIEKLLMDAQNAKEGSFLHRYNVWAEYGGSMDTDREECFVSYGENEDGEYYYEIQSGDEKTDEDDADKKQRAKINDLIDQIGFIGNAAYYVSEIRVIEEGSEYELVLTDAAPSNLATIQQLVGTTEYTSEATLEITIEDGRLMTYLYDFLLEMEGEYGDFEFGMVTYYEADAKAPD